MWGKLQTHGDKKNDAEVLAIAAAGAPLDVIAMFFESHIEELPDLCVEKLAEAIAHIVLLVGNKIAIVIIVCVLFRAEHNGTDAIHVQLHTNCPFNTISPSGHRPGGLFVTLWGW